MIIPFCIIVAPQQWFISSVLMLSFIILYNLIIPKIYRYLGIPYNRYLRSEQSCGRPKPTHIGRYPYT